MSSNFPEEMDSLRASRKGSVAVIFSAFGCGCKVLDASLVLMQTPFLDRGTWVVWLTTRFDQLRFLKRQPRSQGTANRSAPPGRIPDKERLRGES